MKPVPSSSAPLRHGIAAANDARLAGAARRVRWRRLPAWFVAWTAVLVCGATAGALVFVGGSSDGDAVRERLEVVWPDFSELPDSDRGFLLRLANRCSLDRRVKELGPVISCLYEATQSAPRAGEEPLAHLRRLLNSAEMSWSG